MTLGAVLVGLALLAVITPLVVRPLMDPAPSHAGPGVPDRPPRRQAVLASLRDLDFDHKLGKVSADDYASTRAALLAQAAEAMTKTESASLEQMLEEKVQRVRQRLDRGSPSICPGCGNRIMAQDRFCSRCGRGLDLACPICGGATAPQDAFCVECGTRLKGEAPPAA